MVALIGLEPLTNAQKSARYDAKHREERADKARDRYRANPSHVYATIRKSLAKNPAMRLIQSARRRAKKMGINFDITQLDLLPLPVACPIFGVELRYGGGTFTHDAASVDRIDNSKGYIKGNVAIISRRANMIKNSGTAAEHRAIANWMENAHGSR